MYLTLTNIIKILITGGFSKSEVEVPDDLNHRYVRGNIEDRGPCPGLNALANQGYLPRDGKNLTLPMVENALMTALHMNRHLAGSLTLALRPLCRADGTLDLEDTRRHNIIEHDNSFSRHDFYTGDNYTIQPDMVEAMLDDAGGGPVTLRSLAKSFIRRDKESKAAGAPKLSLNLWFVRVLNIAGAINTAQTGGKLTKEVFEALFLEERWASVILDNPKPRTVLTLLGNALGMMRYVVFGA